MCGAAERPGVGLIPTLSFLLKVTAGILAGSQSSDGRVMGFWLLENNYPVSAHNHQELVSGFRAQGFTRFARDHDLVFGGESGFWHRFTLWQKVKEAEAGVGGSACTTMASNY